MISFHVAILAAYFNTYYMLGKATPLVDEIVTVAASNYVFCRY